MTRRELVLLPGLLCDRALWDAQIDELIGGGMVSTAVVPDLTRQRSIKEMAQSVLASAPASFDLVGFSMGGYVAQQVVRLAPERVARLALVDTSGRADEPAQTSRRRALVEVANKSGVQEAARQLLPFLFAPHRNRDGELISRFLEMAERVGAAAFARQQEAIIGRPDSRASLLAVNCPTIVVCGESDRLTPLEVSRELTEFIPDAKLHVVPSAGHMTPLEDPPAVCAVLAEWLR
jgi:pimeloyl-ACP methyl ester carboxylesterase